MISLTKLNNIENQIVLKVVLTLTKANKDNRSMP